MGRALGKYKKLKFSVFQGPVFEFDLATKACISNTPQVPDPYEELFVYVDQSSIPNAEEGLFAKVDVEESTVISFYNGVRYDVKDATIEMENCPYKISLNEDIDLDIPEDMISTDKYKATLAHKVSISIVNDKKSFFLLMCLNHNEA